MFITYRVKFGSKPTTYQVIDTQMATSTNVIGILRIHVGTAYDHEG